MFCARVPHKCMQETIINVCGGVTYQCFVCKSPQQMCVRSHLSMFCARVPHKCMEESIINVCGEVTYQCFVCKSPQQMCVEESLIDVLCTSPS